MPTENTIELQLLRWGEGPSGRTVTFLLPEEDGPHPFKGLRTGPANGQRLGAAFALIHDDETTTPVEPAPQAPARPADGGNGNGVGKRRFEDLPRSQQAGILCGEPAFARFLIEQHAEWMAADEDGQPDVATTLRRICRVESRRDLNMINGGIFDDLVIEYRAWMAAP